MKILHLYGIAAMLLFLGVLIWRVQAQLLILAWCLIGCGAAWILISLWRLVMPAIESTVKARIEVGNAELEYWKTQVDMDLRANMLALAARPGYASKFDANGSIEITPLSHVTHATVPPALPKTDELSQEPSIPSQVRYEDICNQIPRGHALLGISENGLETCEFKDLMTMLISGGSSTGKSNTVAIKLDEAMRIGRNTRMIVIDPHKNKPDSLYNKIRQYEARFLMPVASKDEEIVQALTWYKREFQRRLGLSTEELEQLDDILLISDEVYALVFHREDERIAKLIKVVSGIAGYESRGYGMYAWFLTQKVTGLKWLRDAVMTTICHKMQTMAERVLASNDDRTVARDMDNWTMPGRVVVFGLNLPVTVAQMPLMVVPRTTGTLHNPMTAPEDVRNAMRGVTEPLGYDVPTVPDDPEISASEREKQRVISLEERQAIIDLALADTPRRLICKGLGKGNGYYPVVQQVLNEEGL